MKKEVEACYNARSNEAFNTVYERVQQELEHVIHTLAEDWDSRPSTVTSAEVVNSVEAEVDKLWLTMLQEVAHWMQLADVRSEDRNRLNRHPFAADLHQAITQDAKHYVDNLLALLAQAAEEEDEDMSIAESKIPEPPGMFAYRHCILFCLPRYRLLNSTNWGKDRTTFRTLWRRAIGG